MARMRYNASAERQKIRRLETELSEILRAFRERDPLVRGSFQTLRRRCGKEPCRCVDGKLHETVVFIDRSSGKRRIEKSTVAHEHALKKPAKRYQSLKSLRARISEIHDELLGCCDRLSGHRLQQGERLIRRLTPKSGS